MFSFSSWVFTPMDPLLPSAKKFIENCAMLPTHRLEAPSTTLGVKQIRLIMSMPLPDLIAHLYANDDRMHARKRKQHADETGSLFVSATDRSDYAQMQIGAVRYRETVHFLVPAYCNVFDDCARRLCCSRASSLRLLDERDRRGKLTCGEKRVEDTHRMLINRHKFKEIEKKKAGKPSD